MNKNPTRWNHSLMNYLTSKKTVEKTDKRQKSKIIKFWWTFLDVIQFCYSIREIFNCLTNCPYHCFDSDLKSGGDRDFCLRAFRQGVDVKYIRDMRVFHPARDLCALRNKARRLIGGRFDAAGSSKKTKMKSCLMKMSFQSSLENKRQMNISKKIISKFYVSKWQKWYKASIETWNLMFYIFEFDLTKTR